MIGRVVFVFEVSIYGTKYLFTDEVMVQELAKLANFHEATTIEHDTRDFLVTKSDTDGRPQ